MEIKIKLTNYTMTPEISEYLNDRLATLEKFADAGGNNAICEVEIGRAVGNQQHGDVWKVEMHIVHGASRLYAHSTEESINAAIDATKDELVAQLKKTKGKMFARTRRAGAQVKEWLRFGTK